jgi:DNA-binding HxlR family transcriptional regulator/putative sterol carrier protein
MAARIYGQFCGIARAVELVGERWALLIVRDLILGPKRFTDLRQGLPRIPTNVLAARLRELEQAGIVERRVQTRPQTSIVYGLTEYGRELEAPLRQLGEWGARALGLPREEDIITLDSLLLALSTTFRREKARGLEAQFQLHVGDLIVHAVVRDGHLEVAPGILYNPDLVLEAGPALKTLMAGEISPAEAVRSGAIRIKGKRELLTTFVELFHIRPAPPLPEPAAAYQSVGR